MNMDRTRFLALATLIAAGGCVTKKVNTDSDGGGGVGGTTATGGSGAGGAGGVGGGAGGAGGGVCDDSVGAPGDCGPADATVCGQFAVDACEGAKSYFKPRIAELAVDCITALDPISDCLPVYQCRSDALNQACDDPTADVLCQEIIDACDASGNATTMDECHSYVDGLNDAGRALMQADCGTDGCPDGIYSCVEGVL